MDEVKYNPLVLKEYAEKLYSQARWIAFVTAISYAVVSGAITWVLLVIATGFVRSVDPSAVTAVAGLVAMGGFVIGVVVGIRKGFNLRLEAQRTLCQVQIEENTRQAAMARAAGA